MKLHQQFDLNFGIIRALGRDLMTIPPYMIDKLVTDLTEKGYTVFKSSANFMGIPQSITVIKDFTGPFAARLAAKAKDDFNNISKSLGIENLFE